MDKIKGSVVFCNPRVNFGMCMIPGFDAVHFIAMNIRFIKSKDRASQMISEVSI